MAITSSSIKVVAGFVCVLAFLGCDSNLANKSQTEDITGGSKPQPAAPIASDYPGLIPPAGKGVPANDLVKDGKKLTSEEARKLSLSGVDISTLNPVATTDLWTDNIGEKPNAANDALGVSSGDAIEFVTSIPSVSGNARFTARKVSGNAVSNFTVQLGRRAHDLLLRKALLRKLGYKIPSTSFLNKFTLKFSNTREREIFVKRLASDAMADPARWILQQPDERTLVLQDAVIMNAQFDTYNLASGIVPANIVGGRRLLSSLLVPYSLVSMGENANLFSWIAGRTFDQSIILPYDNADSFSCSREDAIWAARRIVRLSRNDFAEIAHEANLPAEVETLLTEKLVARRNSLRKLLALSGDDISFDSKINAGSRLVNGEIVGENFPGYAERFSYGDPESPLSAQEIWAFVQSRGISAAIFNAVSKLNDLLPKTDVQSQVINHKVDLINKAIAEYYSTGQITEKPMGAFVIPMFGSSLILSRDVVIGTYMGLENKVSLADSVGVNIQAGGYVGFENIPLPATMSAQTVGYIRRIYTHIRPLGSVKAALKSPFKNIIVPLYGHDVSQLLGEITEDALSKLSATDRQKKISNTMSALDDQLGVGESIIITDSIGGDVDVQVGKSFYEILDTTVGVGAGQLMLNRTFVQRLSKETVIVSDAHGNTTTFRVAAGVSAAQVPILTIRASQTEGTATNQVVPLTLIADELQNPNILRVAAALRSVIGNGSSAAAKQIVPGYRLNHKFRDNSVSVNLLFQRYVHLEGATSIDVEDVASGAHKTFYQRRLAERTGNDFQSFAIDGFNAIIANLTKINLSINNSDSDPAGTLGGSSFLRELIYEGVLESAANNSDIASIKEGFFSLTYRWRGWSINRDALNNIVDQINTRYPKPLIPGDTLGKTDQIQFYDISSRVAIAPEGLKDLLRHDNAFYINIFNKYMPHPLDPRTCKLDNNSALLSNNPYCRGFSQFLWFRSSYGGAWAKGHNENAAADLVNAVAAVEGLLNKEDLVTVLGGEKNLFATARIDGFRVGDEAGDTAIVGSTFGRLGTADAAGPLRTLSQNIGLPMSELMATWIRQSL